MHPKGTVAATGEIGAKPWIYVWDTKTFEVKYSAKGIIVKGVVALSFSFSGKYLSAAGIDVDHQVAVFDWEA